MGCTNSRRLWRPSQLRKCRTGSSHLALSQWACPLRLLARTVGRLALRLLARTVEELWAAAMATSGQLSEEAHALLRDWSFFYSLIFFSFYVPLCLVCLEFFSQSVLEFACFFGLSMLPSYCGRVLIALRAYAECKS